LLRSVAAFVFLQGCLLILVGFRAFQAGVTNPRLGLALFACVFVVFSSAIAIASSVRTMAQKLTSRALGIAISREAQPALWEFVHDIAVKLRANPPAQIILGLEPTFYATAADIELIGVEPPQPNRRLKVHFMSGETLFVSLSLMRILSKD